MPVPANLCTAANLIPAKRANIQEQFDLLMNAARNVCDDFQGDWRGDGRSFCLVPACRVGASIPRNLLTVWPGGHLLRLEVRPLPNGVNSPEQFVPGELQLYQQRMAALYETMLQL